MVDALDRIIRIVSEQHIAAVVERGEWFDP